MGDGPGAQSTTQRQSWVLSWLVQAEAHRTEELQNQQARAATVLVANTFLLGLIANAALQKSYSWWVTTPLLFAIASSSVALLAGLVALFPLNPPSNPDFLDRQWLSERVNAPCGEHGVLGDLINSFVPDKKCGDPDHTIRFRPWRCDDPLHTIRFRRWVIRWQLGLLATGTIAALVAVIIILS